MENKENFTKSLLKKNKETYENVKDITKKLINIKIYRKDKEVHEKTPEKSEYRASVLKKIEILGLQL